MTIRVVLAAQADAALSQPAGRVLLVHADHAFSDLAEAIDTAFGRWDLTPLHQFEVEGRILLSPEGTGEDPEDEASDEVTVGEVGLRVGARFSYVFDLGEQWTHECSVEEVGVDPFEVAGDEPEVPVPVYGWGVIPDQYGRLSEDDDEDAEDAAAGWTGPPLDEDDGEPAEDLEDWDADEAASWVVVRDALAVVPREPDDDALRAALARLRSAAQESDAWPYRALWAAADLDAEDEPGDERRTWVALAAGVIVPSEDVGVDAELLGAWAALEPADWAGAVIELVRSGPGTEVTAEAVLDMIARCPEVEEEDLTDEGEAVLLEGLGVAVELWTALGIVADGRLTRLGQWGLPEALREAWDGDDVAGAVGDASGGVRGA